MFCIKLVQCIMLKSALSDAFPVIKTDTNNQFKPTSHNKACHPAPFKTRSVIGEGNNR